MISKIVIIDNRADGCLEEKEGATISSNHIELIKKVIDDHSDEFGIKRDQIVGIKFNGREDAFDNEKMGTFAAEVFKKINAEVAEHAKTMFLIDIALLDSEEKNIEPLLISEQEKKEKRFSGIVLAEEILKKAEKEKLPACALLMSQILDDLQLDVKNNHLMDLIKKYPGRIFTITKPLELHSESKFQVSGISKLSSFFFENITRKNQPEDELERAFVSAATNDELISEWE